MGVKYAARSARLRPPRESLIALMLPLPVALTSLLVFPLTPLPRQFRILGGPFAQSPIGVLSLDPEPVPLALRLELSVALACRGR